MHVLHRSAVAFTLVAFASIALAAPRARADASGADIVAYVNAQRAANGFPAGVVEDPAASAACATWAATGDHTSGSVPRPPAGAITWTPDGLLPDAGPWTATHDPFEHDSAYLPDVLAPRLASFGASEIRGFGCATLAAPGSGPAPAQDVTYTYPGDGAQDTRTSQPIATSGWWGIPWDPEPSGRATRGAILYAFFDGPDFDPARPATATATSATLTGPDGAPLALDVRDATTTPFSTASLPTEIQLVPHDPLQPFTKYTASVAAAVTLPAGGPTRSFTRTWTFTTGALENAAGLGVGTWADPSDPSLLWLEVQSRAPVVTLSATGPGTPATSTTTIATGTDVPQWAPVRLDRPGTWHICVRSGGPGTDFRPAEGCRDLVTVPPVVEPPEVTPPVVTPPAPGPVPAKRLVVRLPAGAHARLGGRVLSVPLRCSAACSVKVGAIVKARGRATRLRTVAVARKSAGSVTVKYTLARAAAQRLRAARTRRITLTIVPRGAATVRRTVAISAK